MLWHRRQVEFVAVRDDQGHGGAAQAASAAATRAAPLSGSNAVLNAAPDYRGVCNALASAPRRRRSSRSSTWGRSSRRRRTGRTWAPARRRRDTCPDTRWTRRRGRADTCPCCRPFRRWGRWSLPVQRSRARWTSGTCSSSKSTAFSHTSHCRCATERQK